MERYIEIHRNKSLRLENVLINNIVDTLAYSGKNDREANPISLEIEVEKMINEIKIKGANKIGPVIQYSGSLEKGGKLEINVALMLQADRFINNLQFPYIMESCIKVKDCMYTRFKGLEDDLQYAYQKIQVEAYENDIKLKDSCYTIFLDSDETGNVIVDVFVEKE